MKDTTKKFHILDEKSEIIDSSNNMLELRVDCHNLNQRLGGNCEVVSNAEYLLLTTPKVDTNTTF